MALQNRTGLIQALARVETHAPPVALIAFVDLLGQETGTLSVFKLIPGAAPGSPEEGWIYANSTDHHLYFYNGSTWKQLDN